MAAVLESVTVLRPCGSRMALSAPATAASVSALSTNRKVCALPEFRGLKVQSPYPRRTLASVSSESRRNLTRSGGIVCEAQETAVEDAVPAVNDATWKSLVIEADLPVLVEFWAPWCGPCRMIHPIINEVSQLYDGKLKCFKLNTDESPSIATEYGIRSIPTIIIFKNGEKKDAVVGAVPKTTLTASIEKFL